MSISIESPVQTGDIKIVKMVVKSGQQIRSGTTLLTYESEGLETVLKSKHFGQIEEISVSVDQVISPGQTLLKVEPCQHHIVMKDMCAECGKDLKSNKGMQKSRSAANVSMIPSIPELRISAQQAQVIANQDKDRLHQLRRLVLLVDLDQTLIHTTQDPGLAAIYQSKDVVHSFQLSKHEAILHTKLRPHCHEFLEKISKLYELQIVTHGTRQYAHKIANIIDPKKTLFSHRILSRDECLHPFKKSGNLQHLFPCGDSMVCIIDDRMDVWNDAPNVILVKKYTYFQGVGDINNPHKRLNPDKNKKETELPAASATMKPPVEDETRKTKKRKSNEELSDVREKKKTKDDVDVTEDTTTVEKAIISSNIAEEGDKTETSDEQKINNDSSKNKQSCNKSCSNNAKSSTNSNNKENEDSTTDCAESSEDSSTLSSNTGVQLKSELSGFSQESSEKFLSSAQSQDASDCFVDGDNYLPCLEEILKQIHETYYSAYDKFEKGEFKDPPDVRGIAPFLKSKVLYGCVLVLTSVIPRNFNGKPERHHVMVAARQLGATVVNEVNDNTTHLIAGKKGTKKYQDAAKRKNIKLVSIDWLYACYECWSHLPEDDFPIPISLPDANGKDTPTNNVPDKVATNCPEDEGPHYDAVTGKLINKVKDARFNFKITEIQGRKSAMESNKRPLYASLLKEDTVVPVVPPRAPAARTRKPSMAEMVGAEYSLGHDDIVDMDKEVDDLMESSDDSSRGGSNSSSSTEDEMAAMMEAELDHED